MPSPGPLKNLPTEVSDRLVGATPAQIQEITLSKIAEYRAQVAKHRVSRADYPAMIEQLEIYIHNLHIIHNSATPLHAKMPPEILMHIFSYLRPSSIRDVRLTLVCHTWRVLLRKVPEFWRDMLSVINMDELNLVAAESLIQLSEPLPLSLKFKRVYSSRFGMLVDPKCSMGTRLSSLSLWMRDLHDMDRFLGLELPCLKSLSILIALRCAVSITRAFSCFSNRPPSQRLPRLYSLTVHGYLLIPPLGVPSLKQLVIIQPYVPTAFAESLRRCSELQSLTLSRCSHKFWTAPNLDPVDLPNLRNMNVVDGRAWVHEQYLDCITYPPTIHLTWTTDSAGPLRRVLPISLSSIISPATRLVIRLAGPSMEGRIMLTMHGYLTESLPRLTLQSVMQPGCFGRYHRYSDLCRGLISLIQTNDTVRHLEWHLDHGRRLRMAEEEWASLLRAFESLSSLVVHISSCRTLFRALRVPSVAPHLRELKVVCQYGGGVHTNIVSAAEARAASGLGLARLSITIMPESERSRYKRLSTGRMAQLKAVVQDLHVTEK